MTEGKKNKNLEVWRDDYECKKEPAPINKVLVNLF